MSKKTKKTRKEGAGTTKVNPYSKVLVVGLGVSGLCTARFLSGQGATVTVSEIRPESALDEGTCKELRELGVTLETGGHNRKTFLTAEIIIVSPGVPLDIEPLRVARKEKIPVIGEMELASRWVDIPIIAVTGTNGKSTVTSLLGRILEQAGLEVFIGGNIGTPLIAYAAGSAAGEKKAQVAVIEVSSFQLDTIDTFRPFVSIILNVSPDHLDRYPDYEAYVQSKFRVFKNQGPGQTLILNDDDERLSAVNPSSGVKVFRYGSEKKEGRHAFIEDNTIRVCPEGKEMSDFPVGLFSLPGKHNLENLLAVVLGSQILGIDAAFIQKTINEFKGLPHRLERIAELEGVIFFNDSKATNVDAAVRSLKSFDQPLILIAGGRHKGADYGPLVRAAEGKVKKAVFLGEAKDILAAAFEGALPFSLAEDMEEAVFAAFSWASSGDVVLLAPACSSFDMFTDYSHRGRVFRSAVERIARA
jgi:UDP-N-acetylmuramoylalanine--D-glutamate ligase